MNAPTLHTPRTRLRAHVASDMTALEAFYQGGRAEFMDMPQNQTHLWYGFASEVGSWDLLGFGAWAIEINGQLAGQIAITHPPHFAEREIGWLMFDGFEGQGYALEAATAALHWAWEQGTQTLVSYIHPDNTRSITLAKRLGAKLDTRAQRHDAQDLVFRHLPDTDGGQEAYA
jgi:RimJ/RimL family protein N-acetyltransferase